LRPDNSYSGTGPKVAVIKCDGYELKKIKLSIRRVFSLLGGVERFIRRGEKVLIKPNFIIPRPPQQAAQTDPAVVIALAQIIKDFGARPVVGDSPAWNSIAACVKALGLKDPLKRLDVPVIALNKPVRRRIGDGSVGISRFVLEADKIINLPKLKTHQQLGATFAIKNMFGCVSGKQKAFLHFTKGKSHEAFCEMLIDIFKLVGPVLTIIDAVVGMEGQGPINGKPKKLAFFVGGVDPLACELVCCKLLKFDPEQLPIIQTAMRMNLGCGDFDMVNVVGDDYKKLICHDFIYPELTPLKFSLPRVFKSVAKHLVLLAGNRFGSKSVG
jgi:uncharacterized protein (DUF362 family)